MLTRQDDVVPMALCCKLAPCHYEVLGEPGALNMMSHKHFLQKLTVDYFE